MHNGDNSYVSGIIKYFPIFILCMFTVVDAHIGDLCCIATRQGIALSSLKTWHKLRLWYENYQGCDDGYFAEDLSDFVEVSYVTGTKTQFEFGTYFGVRSITHRL